MVHSFLSQARLLFADYRHIVEQHQHLPLWIGRLQNLQITEQIYRLIQRVVALPGLCREFHKVTFVEDNPHIPLRIDHLLPGLPGCNHRIAARQRLEIQPHAVHGQDFTIPIQVNADLHRRKIEMHRQPFQQWDEANNFRLLWRNQRAIREVQQMVFLQESFGALRRLLWGQCHLFASSYRCVVWLEVEVVQIAQVSNPAFAIRNDIPDCAIRSNGRLVYVPIDAQVLSRLAGDFHCQRLPGDIAVQRHFCRPNRQFWRQNHIYPRKHPRGVYLLIRQSRRCNRLCIGLQQDRLSNIFRYRCSRLYRAGRHPHTHCWQGLVRQQSLDCPNQHEQQRRSQSNPGKRAPNRTQPIPGARFAGLCQQARLQICLKLPIGAHLLRHAPQIGPQSGLCLRQVCIGMLHLCRAAIFLLQAAQITIQRLSLFFIKIMRVGW